MPSPSPLPTTALSAVSVDTLSWKLGDRAYVTAAVKATVKLVPGGTATLADPLPLLQEDHHTLPGPVVRTPRDLVPSLPQPEVTLIARAYAGGASETTVRLAVFQADGTTLIDKSLLVRGRKGRKGEQRPVDGLPLDYCSALGGIGFAANPLGRGKGGSADQPPSIVDPDNVEAVAGFCPVPAGFASRLALLGQHDPGVVAGALDLPQGFDARYFQAAPADQRVAVLRGDERIVLEHANEEHAIVETRLPGLNAVARLYGDAGATPVTLRLESIHIDAESLVASLVWRKTFPSPAPATPILAVQLAGGGHVVLWPSTVSADEATGAQEVTASEVSPRDRQAVDHTGTMMLEDNGVDGSDGTGTVALGASMPMSLPFDRGARAERGGTPPPAPAPGAPWAAPRPSGVTPAHDTQTETLAVVGIPSPSDAARQERARLDEEARLEQTRLETEAREQALAERDALNQAEAERFAAEQEAARMTEADKRAAKAAERAQAIKALRRKAYGGSGG